MSLLRYALFGFMCVSYVACQTNDADDEGSKWILDIFQTKDQDEEKNKIENKKDTDECICVRKSNCAITTQPTAIDPTTLFTFREKACHYLEECCPPDKVIKTTTNPPPKPSNLCGLSNPGGLVVAREKEAQTYTDYSEFPWMVALLKNKQNVEWSSSDFIGGGSLIHPSVVITSAHKVDEFEANEIKCRAGEWDTNTIKEFYPFQERNVKKIVLHDEYLRLHAHNDVALLILTEPFTLAPNVGIACLGRTPPPLDAKCYSMGWGEDFNNNQKYAVILKRILLPLVGQRQCEIFLRNTKLGSKYTLHNSLMCAGGEEGKDTCIGDGGSPLVCPIENPEGDQLRYAVYGMVAYGVGCGVKNVPGVYVNVPQTYQWIARRIVLEGFTKTQFDY